MLRRGSEVHQPLHRKPFQLVVLQSRNLRLIHPQHLRRLRLRQLEFHHAATAPELRVRSREGRPAISRSTASTSSKRPPFSTIRFPRRSKTTSIRSTKSAPSPSECRPDNVSSSSFTLKPPQASGSSVPASPPRPRSVNMKKSPEFDPLARETEPRLQQGRPGKIHQPAQAGKQTWSFSIPALMPYFPDSESVNRALHAFLAIGDSVQSAASPRRRMRTAAPRANATFDPRKGSQESSLASGD